MTSLFYFEGSRCPHGYEICDDDGVPVIRPKSPLIEPYQFFQARAGQLAAFHVFADIEMREDRALDFANRFGLLFRDNSNPLSEFLGYSSALRTAVDAWRERDFEGLIDLFASEAAHWGSQVHVQLLLVPESARPAIRIESSDLLHALWMQFARAVESDLPIKHCRECHKAFSYGPGTGRRSTAVFCTRECQNTYAYRKRLEKRK